MAYATPELVATLLRRPLTDAESNLVGMMLAPVDALINEALGGAAPDPALVSYVASDVIKSALATTAGVDSIRETAGSFTQSLTYSNPQQQLFLTDAHLALLGVVRRRRTRGYTGWAVGDCGHAVIESPAQQPVASPTPAPDELVDTDYAALVGE